MKLGLLPRSQFSVKHYMKNTKLTALAVVSTLIAGLAAAWAQSSGSFSTQLSWDAYPASESADGFKVYVGFGVNPPGTYYTNYTISNAAATSFSVPGVQGTSYRAAIKAYASDGRQSALSSEVVWTNPPLLSPVAGFRKTGQVFVP